MSPERVGERVCCRVAGVRCIFRFFRPQLVAAGADPNAQCFYEGSWLSFVLFCMTTHHVLLMCYAVMPEQWHKLLFLIWCRLILYIACGWLWYSMVKDGYGKSCLINVTEHIIDFYIFYPMLPDFEWLCLCLKDFECCTWISRIALLTVARGSATLRHGGAHGVDRG